jgi:UDP-glucuronate 4-epimerase
MVETQVGQKALIEILPDQPGDVPYTCANISIAFQELGYNATFPTSVGVAKTVEWYLATYLPPSTATPADAAVTSTTGVRRKLASQSSPEEAFPDFSWLDEAVDEDGVPIKRPLPRRRLLSSPTVQRNDDRKTVLVTGGTKFLGSHLVDALLDRGDRVVLLDQLEITEQSRYNLNLLLQQYGESGRVMVHLGNLTDAAFLRAVFDMEAPQWVCHVTGTDGDGLSFNESIEIVEQTIDPTLHLLDLSKGKRHGGFDVENFVIVGSSKVYGDRSNDHSLLLDEEDRVDAPLTPFAASKKSEELLAYTYHHLYDIPISILRVDAMFGPRHDLHSKSFDQFHQFLQNTTTASSSTAAADKVDVVDVDNWVYVGDVVTALLSALDHQHGYEIFNVGGRNCPQTLRSVFQTMDTLFLGGAPGEGSPQRQPCLSMEKTKQKLQFKPSVTLLEGVMETIQWHRELFDYSRFFSVASMSINPFASSTSRTRSNSRINKSYSSVVHYTSAAVPKNKRRGYGIMRDIACFQWAIVVVVVLYRSYKHHNSKSPRGRSLSPV